MPLRLTSVGQALLDSAVPPEMDRPAALFGSLGLLFVIAALDFMAGREINLTALYLVPIVLSTWNVGRTAGLALAITSAVLSTAGKVAAGATYGSWLVPSTMFVLWTGLFVAFVLVLTQLRRALEREKALARVDPLTGVANRRHFVEVAAVELSRALRHARPLTVAYLDLDNFKQVNDQLGHDAGDGLLLTVARTMRGRLRLSDAIGRMGGDEFAICLPETGAAAAEAVLSDLRLQVAAALPDGAGPVTLSMGAVAYTTPPQTVDELLHRADQALYAAKRGGKNQLKLETA